MISSSDDESGIASEGSENISDKEDLDVNNEAPTASDLESFESVPSEDDEAIQKNFVPQTNPDPPHFRSPPVCDQVDNDVCGDLPPLPDRSFSGGSGDIYMKKGVTDGEMRARPCSYCVFRKAKFSIKERNDRNS